MGDVIQLFAKKRNKKEKDATPPPVAEKPAVDFDEIIEKNRNNKERMAEDALNSNKSTLKSYRIK